LGAFECLKVSEVIGMSIDIMNLLELKSKSLSKGQKRIAEYITENYDKAAYMTASSLAKEVGVSESTVVRFAVEMGFDGYPKFKKALREIIRNKLTSVQRMGITSTKMLETDVLKKVLYEDSEKLKQTVEEIDTEAFLAAVETIDKADTIYVLGARSCFSIANFLGFYLNLIFPNVKVISSNSASETFEQIYRIKENDVMIAISYPRYSRRTINAVKYAADKNSKIIAITDSKTSPITENASHVLCARSDMSYFVDSLVAPLSIINALIVSLVMKRKDDVAKIFTDMENIWDEYEVYEKYDK
jgi:DNA-binding MurR/RpiR family transcriptional regulator